MSGRKSTSIGKAVAAIALAVALLLSACGNVTKTGEVTVSEEGSRFETANAGAMAFIITDTETGVQYLYVKYGYGGGVTPLVDADGKPIVRGTEEVDR